MAKLGFLGLGIMGRPMARNLLRAGHQVAVWSHTAGKAKKLAEEEKGVFCETPKQVGEFAECIFLCVGNTSMSENVILGEGGIAEGARPGTVIVDAG
ncbi:MAG: NAD(P)-binding domain-containing protein, partial [Bryobacteraceae bacterium]